MQNQLTGKDPGAGKDWGQEEKEATEDEMVGWHHWLSGHEFEQTPGDGEGQGSLVCCSPWVAKSRTWLSDWTTTNPCFLIPNRNRRGSNYSLTMSPLDPLILFHSKDSLYHHPHSSLTNFCYSLISVKLVLRGYLGYPNHLSQEFVLMTKS